MQKEYKQGRILLGALPNGQDLLEVITHAVSEAGIKTGSFQLFGAFYECNVAVYNPVQNKYLDTHVGAFVEITAGLGTDRI